RRRLGPSLEGMPAAGPRRGTGSDSDRHGAVLAAREATLDTHRPEGASGCGQAPTVPPPPPPQPSLHPPPPAPAQHGAPPDPPTTPDRPAPGPSRDLGAISASPAPAGGRPGSLPPAASGPGQRASSASMQAAAGLPRPRQAGQIGLPTPQRRPQTAERRRAAA